MKELDCRGFSCPIPVLNTKKALKSNPDELIIKVDDYAAKENVKRLLKTMNYSAEIAETEDGSWRITAKKQ